MFKKKCEHDYKVLASYVETIKDRVWTHILFRCGCGNWYVDTVPGAFTKDEILSLN